MSWLQDLANKIENAQDGDIIDVETVAVKELAESAAKSMCPEKKLTFNVKEIDRLAKAWELLYE